MGTTYYVSPSGSNTAPYDTWLKAATVINTIFTSYNLGTGDIIEIDGGVSGITYSGTGDAVIAPGTNDEGVEIKGSTADNHNGPVTADGTVQSNHGIYIPLGAPGIIVRNIKFKAGGSAKRPVMLRDSCSFYDVEVDGSTTNTNANAVDISGTITVLMDRMNIHEYNGNYGINIAGNATVTLQRSKVWGFYGTNSGPAVLVNGASAVFTSNNNIYSNLRVGILQLTDGTMILNNDAMFGLRGGTPFTVASGKTITFNNCLINPRGSEPQTLQSGTGTIVYNNCLNSYYPYFESTKTGNIGRIAITLDVSNYDYLADAVINAHKYNIPIGIATCVFNIKDWGTESEIETKLRILYANGANEIINHSFSHPYLGQSQGFKTSYVGAHANPRIVVVGTYPNLTVSAVTDSGTDVGPLDVTNTLYDTTSKVRMAIDAHADWSTAIGTNASYGTQSKGLKVATTTVGTNTSIPLDIDTDYNHWKAEIIDATTYIENILGVGVVKSIAYPYGDPRDSTQVSTSLQTWLNNNITDTHINGARTCWPGNVTSPSASTLLPESLQIMGIGTTLSQHIVTPDILTATGETIRQNIRAWVDWIVQTGMLGTIIIHESEVSSDQFGYILSELSQAPNITFMRFGDYVDYIKENWTNIGSGVYTKALTDQSDYRLRYNSPNINAGINVGLNADCIGNPICGLIDIGCYEYQSSGVVGMKRWQGTKLSLTKSYGNRK